MDQILVTLKTPPHSPLSFTALPHTHLPCLNGKIKSLFHSAGRRLLVTHQNNSAETELTPSAQRLRSGRPALGALPSSTRLAPASVPALGAP